MIIRRSPAGRAPSLPSSGTLLPLPRSIPPDSLRTSSSPTYLLLLPNFPRNPCNAFPSDFSLQCLLIVSAGQKDVKSVVARASTLAAVKWPEKSATSAELLTGLSVDL